MEAISRAVIPTRWGVFEMIAYADDPHEPMPHLALVHEKTPSSRENVLTRIHSE